VLSQGQIVRTAAGEGQLKIRRKSVCACYKGAALVVVSVVAGLSGWEFWIDRGGTFTDVIGVAPDGAETTLKLLSVSPAYEDAAVAAMRRLMDVPEAAPFPAARVKAIKLGTTVATNALLERKGARTLLVTTRGFADALEIGDQARPSLFALDIVKPAPLHAGVIEADERLDAAGAVVRPLDEVALAAALRRTFLRAAHSCMHSMRLHIVAQRCSNFDRCHRYSPIRSPLLGGNSDPGLDRVVCLLKAEVERWFEPQLLLPRHRRATQ